MSKPISKKTVWIVSLGFFIILSAYTLFQYQKIKTRIPVEKTDARANKDRKSIRVPQFVALEKVFYRSRFYFTFDSPQTLEKYRETENLDGVVEGWKNDFDLARKLMNWCRAQWEPGRPDPYPPINAIEILREIGQNGPEDFVPSIILFLSRDFRVLASWPGMQPFCTTRLPRYGFNSIKNGSVSTPYMTPTIQISWESP